jgi:hypothetical protein
MLVSKSAKFLPIFAQKAFIFAIFLPVFAHFLQFFTKFILPILPKPYKLTRETPFLAQKSTFTPKLPPQNE